MIILGHKMYEVFALQAVIKNLDRGYVYVYVTLIFDSKIILMIWIASWYLHILGNHCARYEHPWSKNEGGVGV